MEQKELDGEVVPSVKLIREGFEMVLEGLGFDWRNEPHMQETPMRAAEAWFFELCQGKTGDAPKITLFKQPGDSGMVILNHIPVKSMCAHHLLPFVGEASVGYVMEDQIIGLSKLSRIVDYFSRRPQVQEDLTNQIADFLEDLKASGVGVVIKASHLCMVLRGTNHESEMVTSALRGVFLDAEVRAEFLKLAGV